MKKALIPILIAVGSAAIAPAPAHAFITEKQFCEGVNWSQLFAYGGKNCASLKKKYVKPKRVKKKADETVRSIQKLLNELGYNAGTADGLYGRKTGNALTEFYQSIGQKYDGKADAEELAALIDFSKNGASQSTVHSQNTSNDSFVKDAVKQQSGTAWGQSEQAPDNSNRVFVQFTRGDEQLGALTGGWANKPPQLMNTALVDIDEDGVAEIAYHASDECDNGSCRYNIAYYYDGEEGAGWKRVFSGVGMAPLFFTKNDDGRIQNLMLGGIEAKWTGEKYEFADEGWDILEALSPISHFGNKMVYFDNVNVNLLKKVWNSGDYKIYQGNFVTISNGSEYIIKPTSDEYCDDDACYFWMANSKKQVVAEGWYPKNMTNIMFKPSTSSFLYRANDITINKFTGDVIFGLGTSNEKNTTQVKGSISAERFGSLR